MRYTDTSREIFKRIIISIVLSLIVTLVITWVLLYLYRIIRNQKEISEVKNDLISNITHEFKTPIATVMTAIESIEKFNNENDTERTKKYLQLSTSQLKKLDFMVEKLLETATLDSDNISLNKREVDVDKLVSSLIRNASELHPDKNLEVMIKPAEITVMVDPFHFENAINNLVDNAIKYGGENIRMSVSSRLENLSIIVADDGFEIPKNKQAKIFEKFYRGSTGNVHDIKGFGIGLYYSQKIIEKHGGSLVLRRKQGFNEFEINLPL